MNWSRVTEEAVLLLADGKLTDKEIVAKLGCSERQLNRWKLDPEFQTKRKAHVELWKESIRERLLCLKEGRIESMIADFQATDVILKERGEQLKPVPEEVELLLADNKLTDADVCEKLGVSEDQVRRWRRDPGAAGGSTGFICRDYRGKEAITPVYLFDAALFRERRAIREQIADELGQLVRRAELTGKDGQPLIPLESVRAYIQQASPDGD